MPSARPFISFLFGSLQPANGGSAKAPSTSSSHSHSHSHPHAHSSFSQHAQSLRTSSTSPIAPGTLSTESSPKSEYHHPQVTQPMAIRGHGPHGPALPPYQSANNFNTNTNSNNLNKLPISPIPSPGSPTANFPPYERHSSVGSLTGSNGPGPDSNKWWIGGKASDGSEKYYRLQAPHALSSHRSFDRLSLDRLSI